MTKIAEGPNAAQIAYWNEATGVRWAEMGDVIDAQIAPLGAEGIERAGVEPGERVLDVGCGCGHTTVELARRVGKSGRVLGVDISAPMLESARLRVARAKLQNVRFVNADAQVHAFEPGGYDLLFSRFGVMFFAEPERAFANLLAALRPGGRLTFVSWQPLARNPWMQVPLMAAAKHLTLPGPLDPHAPGPFAFADEKRVEGILTAGGFREVAHESLARDLVLGGGRTLDEAVDFLMQLGPAGALLRDAAPEQRERVRADIQVAIEPFAKSDGVHMAAAAWIVTARKASPPPA